MASNGTPGKRIDEATRVTVIELLDDGHTVQVVAKRAGISTSLVRNIQREHEAQKQREADEAALIQRLWPG